MNAHFAMMVMRQVVVERVSGCRMSQRFHFSVYNNRVLELENDFYLITKHTLLFELFIISQILVLDFRHFDIDMMLSLRLLGSGFYLESLRE